MPSPTWALVTLWGFDVLRVWAVRSSVSALASSAACVAVETGLLRSAVLSTLDKPTCALVTAWGLVLSAMCRMLLSRVSLDVGDMAKT